MNDKKKTKDQLVDELATLRNRVSELEAAQFPQRELRESEAKYRSLYEEAPLAYQSLDERGRLLDVNRTWLDVLGYSSEEVMGKWFGSLLDQESQERFRTGFSDLVSAGGVDAAEFTLLRQDGSAITTSFHAKVSYDQRGRFRQMHCIVLDITENKRIETAVMRAKREWELTFDTVPDLIMLVDNQNRILRVNRAMASRLHLHPREMIGKTCCELVHGEGGPPPECPHLGAVADGQEHTSEVVSEALGGVFVISCSPLHDRNGRLIGSVHVARDITQRKRAEEELRKMRERLELALEGAELVLWNLDLQTGQVVLTERGTELLGYSLDEIHSDFRWWRGLVHPDDLSRVIESMTAHLEARTPRFECEHRLRAKSGEWRWILNRGKVVERAKEGKPLRIMGTSLDITDRKLAEEAIRKNKETLEAVLNATTDAAYLVDAEGNLLTMNQTTARRFNKTVDELLGRSVFDLLPPALVARRRALHIEVLRTGKGVRFQDERDGEVIANSFYPVVESVGVVTRVAVFSRDITEQQLAKEARRESEERFRAIFRTARDCVYIKDVSLKYTHVNPAMEQLFGIPATELVGKTDDELFEKEVAQRTVRADTRVLQGEIIEEEHTRSVKGQPVTLLSVMAPLRNTLGEVVGICGIARDITGRRPSVSPPLPGDVAFRSKVMRSTLAAAQVAAKTDSILLLTGESGSGKDYLAGYIHDHSKRAGGPFFTINCAAVAQELAEAELFGHERGAFTGSTGRLRGLLELAEGGTLLLNEIGELPLPLQAKLLTFLDTRSFTRVGGRDTIKVDARLIAATNRDLEEEVRQRRFRADLFYRLNVFSIKMPPLRERAEDIPVLVKQIIPRLAVELRLAGTPEIDPGDLERLTRYRWPGNVRELKNVLERALILYEGDWLRINPHHPDRADISDWSYAVPFPSGRSMTDLVKEMKRELIEEALRRSGGTRQDAAALLGISRYTLRRQIQELGLPR